MPRKSSKRRSRRRRSRRRRRGGKMPWGKKDPNAPVCPRVSCMNDACRKREDEREQKNKDVKDPKNCVKAASLTEIADKKLGDMGATGILSLVARYVRDLLKPDTKMQKTRQLMLDSFIYASLVADEWKRLNGDKKPIQPIYGVHTYLDGQPAVTGGRDEEHKEGQAPQGGRRRRRSRRRRKSRRKSRKSRRKRRKSRRKRKRSRRRRRRR